MGTRYVVAVMKVEDIEGSDNRYDTRDTTLFEVTHTDPGRLMRFVGGEVFDVLSREAGDAEPAAGGAIAADAEPLPVGEGDRVDAAEPEKPKRARRNKAQIDADKAAAAAGYRDAAHQAEAEKQPHPAAATENALATVPENQTALGGTMSAPAAVSALDGAAPAQAPWPVAAGAGGQQQPEPPFNPFQ